MGSSAPRGGEILRLILASHAMTEAMVAGRFPADEPLTDTGCRQARSLRKLLIPHVNSATHQLTGPERRVQQTARLAGLTPVVEPRLADLDCPGWCGMTLTSIEPEELKLWQTDPSAAPHGGESLIELIARVAQWLLALAPLADDTARMIAVSHPAVIRAAILIALDIPPKSFWRIDIAPSSCTVLHLRGQLWRLRL